MRQGKPGLASTLKRIAPAAARVDSSAPKSLVKGSAARPVTTKGMSGLQREWSPGTSWKRAFAATRNLLLSLILPPIPLADAQHDPVVVGDAELKAFGDVASPGDEVAGGERRAQLLRGLLKQRQPAVEVFRVHRQPHMFGHRPAAVDSGRQRHRRPEPLHLRQMGSPVLDPLGEDGPEQRIGSNLAVEAFDQVGDQRLIDAGGGADAG
eukprot:Opistho-1_new@28575